MRRIYNILIGLERLMTYLIKPLIFCLLIEVNYLAIDILMLIDGN